VCTGSPYHLLLQRSQIFQVLPMALAHHLLLRVFNSYRGPLFSLPRETVTLMSFFQFCGGDDDRVSFCGIFDPQSPNINNYTRRHRVTHRYVMMRTMRRLSRRQTAHLYTATVCVCVCRPSLPTAKKNGRRTYRRTKLFIVCCQSIATSSIGGGPPGLLVSRSWSRHEAIIRSGPLDVASLSSSVGCQIN